MIQSSLEDRKQVLAWSCGCDETAIVGLWQIEMVRYSHIGMTESNGCAWNHGCFVRKRMDGTCGHLIGWASALIPFLTMESALSVSPAGKQQAISKQLQCKASMTRSHVSPAGEQQAISMQLQCKASMIRSQWKVIKPKWQAWLWVGLPALISRAAHSA